jgi:hypothetical protein
MLEKVTLVIVSSNALCRLFLERVLVLAVVGMVFSCWGSEYEVDGWITQIIAGEGGKTEMYSNQFTVFVRDCSWLIRTIEDVGTGEVRQREVGCVNGKEIYEVGVTFAGGGRAEAKAPGTQSASLPTPNDARRVGLAFISPSSTPVGHLDVDGVAHLWLMFASGCYWSGTRTNWLTPVYDWHASVGTNPDLKVEAEWELLNGPGSLPREVRYLGRWYETNGLYRVTGTNSAGGTLLPSGFTFEERHAFVGKGMVLRKRVDARVTSVQAVCPLASLLPIPVSRTIVMDQRLTGGSAHAGKYSDYMIAVAGRWPSLEEARQLAEAHQARLATRGASVSPHAVHLVKPRRIPIVVALVCCLSLVPLGVYLLWRRSQTPSGKT